MGLKGFNAVAMPSATHGDIALAIYPVTDSRHDAFDAASIIGYKRGKRYPTGPG